MDQPGSEAERTPDAEQAQRSEQDSGHEQTADPDQTPDAEQMPGSEQTPDAERTRGSDRRSHGDAPRAFTQTAKLGAGIAVTGIVGTGLLDFLLSQYGSPAAGRLVWAIGFTLTVLVLWYVVLRPMEITGP